MRVIEYTLPAAPERVYRLLTNLTPQQAAAAELAALYRECWELEHVFREIKSQLITPEARAALRGRTPMLVHQELRGLMLGHYEIHARMHAAAKRNDEYPDRLSFAYALRTVRRRRQSPGAVPHEGPSAADEQAVTELRRKRNPIRLGRREERAVRRLDFRYPILRSLGCGSGPVPDSTPTILAGPEVQQTSLT